MLTCQNITISRGYNILIEKLGFSLFQGSCLNIYGANGCGKTTLMNYLASLSDVSKSSIIVNNIDVLDALDEYRQIMCYIGHKNALRPELTVLENLKFWAKLQHREITLPAAMECFGLTEYADYPIHKLSQGWQRKVALSKLLISDARIWLLDEPFANLDQEGIEYLQNLIKIRCDQKGVVIFTSHTPISNTNVCHLNLKDFSS
jgi:heme exporter protein A